MIKLKRKLTKVGSVISEIKPSVLYFRVKRYRLSVLRSALRPHLPAIALLNMCFIGANKLEILCNNIRTDKLTYPMHKARFPTIKGATPEYPFSSGSADSTQEQMKTSRSRQAQRAERIEHQTSSERVASFFRKLAEGAQRAKSTRHTENTEPSHDQSTKETERGRGRHRNGGSSYS